MQSVNKYPGLLIMLFLFLWGCHSRSDIEGSEFLISNPGEQRAVFENLVELTKIIPLATQNDSLAFLILPVHASCPFCRKKTIDKIAKHFKEIDNRHFVIISANGGKRTILGYFSEQGYSLPKNRNFVLDSLNDALKHGLYRDKPTIYYSFNKRVYKRVEATPHTVRKDLTYFFGR